MDENPTWYSRWDKSLKMSNCYIYAIENNKIVLKMSWQLWKEITERYFHKAKKAIIYGETLRLGHGVGKIRGARNQRNFKNPYVDWATTRKLNLRKPDGRLQRVYFTTEDYCMIQWVKTSMIPNKGDYNFDAATANTTTGKGFRKEFSEAVRNNIMLKYKFVYNPLKPLANAI
jgi:hypothetical protein